MITVEPGKKVACVPLGQGAMTFSVVKSVGKRDIVLESGARFSVHDQTRRAGGTWGTTYQLADVDSPGVLARVRESKIRRYASQVADLAQAISAGNSKDQPRDVAKIAALVGRLTELTELAADPEPAP